MQPSKVSPWGEDPGYLYLVVQGSWIIQGSCVRKMIEVQGQRRTKYCNTLGMILYLLRFDACNQNEVYLGSTMSNGFTGAVCLFNRVNSLAD